MTDERAQRIIFLAVALLVIVFGANFNRGDTGSAARAESSAARVSWVAPADVPLFVLSSPGVPEEAASATVQSPPSPPPPSAASPSRSTTDAGTLGIAPGAIAGSSAFRLRKTVADAPPSVQAAAALVADLETGESYFAKDADRRRPIASLTKLVTAAEVVSIEDLSRTRTIAAADFPPLDDSVYQALHVGETYTLDDLITAMLTISSNVAAQGAANYFGAAEFVAAMNKTARSWGLSHTYFSDPTGLSVANQSTANDLRLLARVIADEFPELFAITRRPENTVTDLATGTPERLANINEFAGDPSFVGGKTGYTDIAQENLLSVFDLRGRRVVVIVLGSQDRFGDSRELWQWFKTNYIPAS